MSIAKGILVLALILMSVLACDPCYNDNLNRNCGDDGVGK